MTTTEFPEHVDLYVIGPVTGLPKNNKPAFEEARKKLRASGYSVAIPHDFIPEKIEWKKAMWLSVAFMLTRASGVAFLDGDLSRGSTLEMGISRDLEKPIGPVAYWEKRARTAPASRWALV